MSAHLDDCIMCKMGNVPKPVIKSKAIKVSCIRRIKRLFNKNYTKRKPYLPKNYTVVDLTIKGKNYFSDDFMKDVVANLTKEITKRELK